MFRYTAFGGEPRYTRCYRCGTKLGTSGMLMYAMAPRRAGILDSVRFFWYYLNELRREIAMRWSDGRQDYCQRCRKDSDWKDELPFRERRAVSDDALGAAVSPSLLADAPFAVYGLRGNPMGLRLSDLELNQGESGQASLRYTAGAPDAPQRALDLHQGAGLAQDSSEELLLSELRAVVGLAFACSHLEQRESYLSRRNVHRDWNLDYLSRTLRRNVTIQIDGEAVSVELAHWQEPQQVALARLALAGRPAMAVSIGLSQVQLLSVLKGLVALRRDADALAQHERD